MAGVVVRCGVGLVAWLGPGLLTAPITAFVFFGTMDAVLVLLIHMLVNIACILSFRRNRRAIFDRCATG